MFIHSLGSSKNKCNLKSSQFHGCRLGCKVQVKYMSEQWGFVNEASATALSCPGLWNRVGKICRNFCKKKMKDLVFCFYIRSYLVSLTVQ